MPRWSASSSPSSPNDIFAFPAVQRRLLWLDGAGVPVARLGVAAAAPGDDGHGALVFEHGRGPGAGAAGLALRGAGASAFASQRFLSGRGQAPIGLGDHEAAPAAARSRGGAEGRADPDSDLGPVRAQNRDDSGRPRRPGPGGQLTARGRAQGHGPGAADRDLSPGDADGAGRLSQLPGWCWRSL